MRTLYTRMVTSSALRVTTMSLVTGQGVSIGLLLGLSKAAWRWVSTKAAIRV